MSSSDKSQRQRILEEFDGRCFYCGIEVSIPVYPCSPYHSDAGTSFNIDHKTPKSKGGTNKRANLVCSCRKCNASKGTLTLEEFRVRKQRATDTQREALKHLKKALSLSPDLLFAEDILAQIRLIEEREYPWFSFYGESEQPALEVAS